MLRIPPPTVRGHVDALRGAADHVEHDRSLLVRSGDVEKDELVRSLRVVGEGGLHGITGIAQVGEAHALDHAPAVDVEARHNALAQHQRSASARASRRHTAPV